MGSTSFQILLIALIIAVNGFFAGAEAALLSTRPSRLRQMAEQGHAGAQAALSLLSNPGRLLSVVQVGVTLASLGLGWAGEDTVFQILMRLFHPLVTPATERFLHGFSFVIAFLIISYCHVVMGEVIPKNLAIAKADRVAVLVSPVLLVFYKISLPFVVTIERSASALMRLMGLRESAEGAVHSAEELKLIVSTSRGHGFLPEAQEDIIHRVLDLDNILAREIMVPRQNIVSLPAEANLDQVLRTIIREGHSRFPVYESSPEKIIGIVHVKDLLPVWEERRRAIRSGRSTRGFRLANFLRPHLVVPETKPLSQMLEEFRTGNRHMAMVVDEFGTIVGMLTVEDVLEQIVGPIDDEHDEKREPRGREMDEIRLDGTTRIRDLETHYGIELPDDEGYETLAGFLLSRFGLIPQPGASVEHQGRRFTVLDMDRNRIARVRIEKLPQPATSEPG